MRGRLSSVFCDSWPMNRIFYICAPFCRILSNARPRVIKFGSLTVFHLPAGLDKPHKRGYPVILPRSGGHSLCRHALDNRGFLRSAGRQPFFHHKIFKRHAMADHGLRAQHAVAAVSKNGRAVREAWVVMRGAGQAASSSAHKADATPRRWRSLRT